MIIHSYHRTFDQIEVMLKSQFESDPQYKNTVFVLGYNITKDSITDIRTQYKGKRIITLQLEQLFPQSRWVAKSRMNFLDGSDEVWDYDQSNMMFLKNTFGIHSKLFTLRYAPELNTLKLLPKEDHKIDILFYGSVSDRRQEVLNALRIAMPDKNILTTTTLWGQELDDAIQTSKIVLNLHYYDINRQEQARLFYLMCNHKCIVSETSSTNYYRNGIVEVAKDRIPSACKTLLETDAWYEYAKNSVKSIILSNEYYKNTGI